MPFSNRDKELIENELDDLGDEINNRLAQILNRELAYTLIIFGDGEEEKRKPNDLSPKFSCVYYISNAEPDDAVAILKELVKSWDSDLKEIDKKNYLN